MADLAFNRIANALQGFGAGVAGRGGQFIANQRALSEDRRNALLADNRTALGLLRSGDTSRALQLLNNRVQNIRQLGGTPNDTMAIIQRIQSGDVAGSINEMSILDSTAVARGVLRAPPAPPETFSSVLNDQGQVVAQRNNVTGEMKKSPLAISGAGSFRKAPGVIVRTEEGLAFSIPVINENTGEVGESVTPITGDLVSRLGESPIAETMRKILQAKEIEQAQRLIETGTAAGIKSEQIRGGAVQKRRQSQIESGLMSADGMANVSRSLELLEGVETGGIDNLQRFASQFFGIESADEAELSFQLGKNVLAQLRSIFGAAFTAKEGETLASIEAGFGKSTAGNIRLLQQTKKLMNRVAQRGIKAAVANEDFETAAEIKKALAFTLTPEPPKAPGAMTIERARVLAEDTAAFEALSVEEAEEVIRLLEEGS